MKIAGCRQWQWR